MKVNEFLVEGTDAPKALLVVKAIWLNLKSNDDVIGWQTKQGFFPATARGLAPGDLLVGSNARHTYVTYTTVVRSSDGSVVKGLSPEFSEKELTQLISDKILKVVVK